MAYRQTLMSNISSAQKQFSWYFYNYVDYLKEAYADLLELFDQFSKQDDIDSYLIPAMVITPIVGTGIFIALLIFVW